MIPTSEPTHSTRATTAAITELQLPRQQLTISSNKNKSDGLVVMATRLPALGRANKTIPILSTTTAIRHPTPTALTITINTVTNNAMEEEGMVSRQTLALRATTATIRTV